MQNEACRMTTYVISIVLSS